MSTGIKKQNISKLIQLYAFPEIRFQKVYIIELFCIVADDADADSDAVNIFALFANLIVLLLRNAKPT